ncbi:cobalt transporter [Afipia sp. Root123D2]|uniref:cation transporter n=1 Tax=Afipia sp. Root123D2 TaxID=1736436 RepID=UPI0006FDA294|nr:cation transporter [Afipia sp. Root123D2]KQW22424.1 cobalt transporter [Afipia sp. Root123D2]
MDDCCAPPPLNLGPKNSDAGKQNDVLRRVLWAVLVINGVMFAVEVVAGLAAGSASLQADALDFLGDTANYAISLLVVGMALRYRASAAMAKGLTMAAFGLWVVAMVIWHIAQGTLPSALTMGTVGIAALVANAVSFGLLWAYRHGDSNMRSAWICTRNDVLGNLAVLVAAAGVFGTGTGWPDIIVAAIMAALALQGAVLVIRQAFGELRHGKVMAAE